MSNNIIIGRYKKTIVLLTIFTCLMVSPGFSQVNKTNRKAKTGYTPDLPYIRQDAS